MQELAKRRNEVTSMAELKRFVNTWDDRYCKTWELNKAIMGVRQEDGSFVGGLPSRIKAIIAVDGRPLATLTRAERIGLGAVNFRDMVEDYDEVVLDLIGLSFETVLSKVTVISKNSTLIN